MLPKDTNSLNYYNMQHLLNNFVIKIDYFDHEGNKNSENKVPLECILHSSIKNKYDHNII